MGLLGAELSDQVDQLFRVIAVSASDLHELSCLGEHGAALRGAGDVDAPPAAELQQPLIAQQPYARSTVLVLTWSTKVSPRPVMQMMR